MKQHGPKNVHQSYFTMVPIVSPISYAQMCAHLLLLYVGMLKGNISIEVVLVIKAYIWENNINYFFVKETQSGPLKKTH